MHTALTIPALVIAAEFCSCFFFNNGSNENLDERFWFCILRGYQGFP